MVIGSLRLETEVAVIGGGPGGYIAALRAADLGKDVTLIDEREQLGGVCLLEGCIPSKTLINAVELIGAARRAEQIGLTFSELKTNLNVLRDWTQSVVSGLAKGVDGLVRRRGIELIRGRARFESLGPSTDAGPDRRLCKDPLRPRKRSRAGSGNGWTPGSRADRRGDSCPRDGCHS